MRKCNEKIITEVMVIKGEYNLVFHQLYVMIIERIIWPAAH